MQQSKTQHLDIEKIRKNFPILNRKVHGKNLVYFDNAATSQKPKVVIDAITHYYENYNANVHRSIHVLGEEATAAYEKARGKIGDFINAKSHQEVIFTKNSTEALNLLAYSLTADLKAGDEIVISQLEHHSNFVPWQQMAKLHGLKLKFIEINKDGSLSEESIRNEITKNTKIVSVNHISNAIGSHNPVEMITQVAHENGALMVIDGSQSVPHMKVDVQKIDADFYVFTGHKMLGPTGVGVLHGKKEILEKMRPFLYGGEMINEVGYDDTTFNKLPYKFEAGTPNIIEGIGLGVAVDYLKEIGMENIHKHDMELTNYALEKLRELDFVEVYGPEKRGSLVSFNVKKVHAHDVSQILDSEGIAIRAGHHCAMPLMKTMGISSTARASFYLYNTEEEVDHFITSLSKVRKVFGV